MTEAVVDAVYAGLPRMRCKQGPQCVASCHSIAMTTVERERIAQRTGLNIADGWYRNGCPALNPFGSCRIYLDRPMVCRLWGMVPSMPCPHGCVPEGGMMTEAEGRAAMGALLAMDRARGKGAA